MGNFSIEKTGYQFFTMLLLGLMILTGQKIGLGTSIFVAFPGMMMLIVAALSAMMIKDIFPKSIFPAFGWATILGFVLSMPYSPTSEVFLRNVENINFMALTTPILAFAGISVGNKVNELKKMSWKLVVVALITFTAIYFTCASIAQFVLQLQGRI
ncbi:hypothetical protein SAMN05192551_103151 [Tindallia magadiensis]|uniref:DUF340 domain-containing protein n=1 Tax=Tindallia magadiensis TaxID=69895 RepID=A0A1I3D4X2_9FIRM|nr:hypothetical protein [Tindallia magadiensis]SFH81735.1 hypothetical protein SAMN05192551_103151 [Tindallia magadiensis]